jgi:aspartate-semialdehyde dehydrogenase
MERRKISIIGGETLLGREVRELLAQRLPETRLKLIGSQPAEEAVLSEVDDEPTVITPLDEDNLSGSAAVFLAGAASGSRTAYDLLQRGEERATIIDLSRALEDKAQARLRAPLAEPAGYRAGGDALHVIAHPAATALAMFLRALAREFEVRRTVAQIFEPASERGQRGLDEIHQQTVNLLSFKGLPKAVYDAQTAFNMLPRYGAEAPVSLESIEQVVERHLASLLSRDGGALMPSIRLAQAPVFHGYTFSIWVEFTKNPGEVALRDALSGPNAESLGPEDEGPTNVGCAGQGGITVGSIRADRNEARAAWFWMVADNLRLTAENAVEVAKQAFEEQLG